MLSILEKNDFIKNIKRIKDISDLENRITQAIKIEDENERQEAIKQILIAMYSYFSINSDFNEICNMKIELSGKLRFFMMASKISCEEEIPIDGSFDFFDGCFEKCTKDFYGFQKDVLELLKNDMDLQKVYATYFKMIDYKTIVLEEEMKVLLNLPMIRDYVLTDEEFICKSLKDNEKFYLSLPDDFGYLIAYSNSFYNNIESLYLTYFREKLGFDQNKIEELIDLHRDIYEEKNPFNISTKYRLKELVFALKKILSDNDFFYNVKKIQEKTNMNFRSAINFVYKYYDTDLYVSLVKKDGKLSSEFMKKIEYLANSRKKPYIQNLANVELLTLEDLEDLDEEIDKDSRISIERGPNSETGLSFYPDSAEKEIRRIDKNGRTYIINNSDDHIEMLKSMYDGEIVCESNVSQVFAAKVAEQLGSITELIENETCFVFTPENPSLIQKKICIEWLRTGRGNGGIFVYYKKLNDFFSVTGDLIDAKPAIKYVLRLGNRITEEDIDNVKIPEFKEEYKEPKGEDR